MNRPLYMLSQLFLTTVKIKKKKQKEKTKQNGQTIMLQRNANVNCYENRKASLCPMCNLNYNRRSS